MIKAEILPSPYQTQISNGEQSTIADTATDHNDACGFRPYELLEAGLASCMSMTLRMCAEKYAMPLIDATVTVTLERSDPAHPCFVYQVDLVGDELTEAHREKLLSVLERCPVRKTLSASLQFSYRA